MKARRFLAIPIALFSLLPTACGSSAPAREKGVVVMSDAPSKPGPPPHAPAHGYRHRFAGRDLVYDSRMHVYVVVGQSETYYCKGRYYRPRGTTWMAATEMDGKWTPVKKGHLPQGLRVKKVKSPVVN